MIGAALMGVILFSACQLESPLEPAGGAEEKSADGDKRYTVSIAQLSHGSIGADPVSAKAGASIALTVTADIGYQLTTGSLKVNDGAVPVSGSGTAYTFIMPAADSTVRAVFEAISYSVNIGQLSHGSISVDPGPTTAESTVTLTVNPEAGYRLKEGSLKVNDGAVPVSGSGNTYTFTMPAADVAVSAIFEALPSGTYSVSTADGVHPGTIQLDKTDAEPGTIITITVHETGYRLQEGSLKVNNGAVPVSGSGNTYTFTMPAGNVTVSAVFEAIMYSVSITQPGNGSISASPIQASEGSTVTLTVSPDAHYQLQAGSLKVNDGTVPLSGSGSTYTFTMPAADSTVSAVFEAIRYPVNIVPLSHGSVSADLQMAAAGSIVTLTVNPASGYTLQGVTVSGAVPVSGSGSTYTFTMPAAAVTVSAVFEANLTADITFVTTGDNTSEIGQPDWQGNGAAQTWIFGDTAIDGTTLYFAANKLPTQTITVGGTDAERVSVATSGSALDGSIPSDILAVITVTFNKLENQFGTDETLSFTLNVSEPGKASKTIAVTLPVRPKLSGVAVFTVAADGELTRVAGVKHWDRNAKNFTDDDATELLDALAWIDHNAENNAEYLVRVEAETTKLPQVLLSCRNQAVTIRLRGYGSGQRVITFDETLSNRTKAYKGPNNLTCSSSKNSGFINVGATDDNADTIPATNISITLQLEDKITLKSMENRSSNVYNPLICIRIKSTLILKDGSIITGLTNASSGVILVEAKENDQSGVVYMYGGSITGNTFGVSSSGEKLPYCSVIWYNALPSEIAFTKTGGTITGNTLVGSTEESNEVWFVNGHTKYTIEAGKTYELPVLSQ
jgi:hypothetical protein